MENTFSLQPVLFMDQTLLHTYLDNFRNHLLNQKHFSAHTAKCYLVDLEQFFKFIRKPINDITEEDINNFINNKLGHYASASVARKIASLRTFFKWGVRSKVVNQFPFMHIKSPKTERKKFGLLGSEELKKLFTQMDETKVLQLRDKCIFLLCLNYGLKPTEVLLIKVRDLNFDTKILHVSAKRDQNKIQLKSETLSSLKKYLVLRQELSAEAFLFVNKHKQPLSSRSVRRKLAAYASLAGISREINPMSLRHHFAMQSIADGKDVRDLQKELGHQNVSTTAVYIEAMREQDKRNAIQSNPISQCFGTGPDS